MEKSLWPASAWLYGPPGTGKTAAARKIAAQFTSSSNRVSLYINCWERPTLYSAARALCEQLKVLDAEAWDTNIKLSRLKQVFKNRTAVIILDEIDRCTDKERDSIIYQLLGLGKTALFCISRGCCTFLRLEERLQSKLTPAHIHFPKYSVLDLKAILAERVWQALGAGTWTEAVLEKIAQLDKNSGNYFKLPLSDIVKLKKLFDTLHRRDRLTVKGFACFMRKIKTGLLKRMRRPPDHKLAKKLAMRFRDKAAENYFRFLTEPEVEPTTTNWI